MRKTLPLTALLCLVSFFSRSQTCDELISYRDSKLIAEYLVAFKVYTINGNVLNDIAGYRQQLLTNTNWVTSDWNLLIGIIAADVKTVATAATNISKFFPATAVAGQVTDATAQQISDLIRTGTAINTIVHSEGEKTAYKLMLGLGGPVATATKTMWDFYEDVQKMVSLPGDRDKLKAEVSRILDLADATYRKYQNAMFAAAQRLASINRLKEGIDIYLTAHCAALNFESSFSNSNEVKYGGNGSCAYSAQMLNAHLKFTINNQKTSVSNVIFSCEAIENLLSACPTPKIPRNTHSYIVKNAFVSGSSVTIFFSPATTNKPHCDLRFSGAIKGNIIDGSLSWERNDVPAPLRYHVEAKCDMHAF